MKTLPVMKVLPIDAEFRDPQSQPRSSEIIIFALWIAFLWNSTPNGEIW